MGRPTRPKSYGVVSDKKSKKGIPNTIIRIFDTKYHRLLDTQVSDGSGRYAFLVGQNKYQLNAQKSGYQAVTTEELDLSDKKKEAIIDKNISLVKNR